ncbi:MAG TPA: GNAT family N-acetyltransferase [Armatimonadota bacterium]
MRCLYLLTAMEGRTEVDRWGFRLADIRMTLERNTGAVTPGKGVRPARDADIPALAAIARESHTDSRFYADPGFPRERCDALYQTWIEKSCRGYAKAVLVAEQDGRPAGYITCDWSEDVGHIGLVAVAGWARGAGLGRELVNASVDLFLRGELRRVSVVTQGRNVSAQRLYQRCGFLTASVQLWYHRWFPGLCDGPL